MHGHEVVIFDARRKPGGLNEYGIAAYKTVDNFAQREVDFILSIGGITIETGQALGRDFSLGDRFFSGLWRRTFGQVDLPRPLLHNQKLSVITKTKRGDL